MLQFGLAAIFHEHRGVVGVLEDGLGNLGVVPDLDGLEQRLVVLVLGAGGEDVDVGSSVVRLGRVGEQCSLGVDAGVVGEADCSSSRARPWLVASLGIAMLPPEGIWESLSWVLECSPSGTM